MTRIEEKFEVELARLTTETDGLRPRADFTIRVMAQLESQRREGAVVDWSTQVLRWAKVGVAVASVAAAVLVGVAFHSSDSADQEEALAYGIVEAFE